MIKEDYRIKLLKIVVLLFLLTWCFGFCGFFQTKDSPVAIISYPVFKQIYSNVCHQNEIKTINNLGFNFFVCARCTGIYLGCLLISFLSLFGRLKTGMGLSYLYIALMLIVTDVLFVMLNVYEYSKLISFITGVLLGSVIYFYFLEILENLVVKISVVKNNA